MSEPFLAEIKIVSFNFPPKGWAACNGQLLPINQNQALFSLLGTTYGGNGQTTFALPDFRGRVPCHWGGDMSLGEVGGEDVHALTPSEMPQHTHLAFASDAAGDTPAPNGNLLGNVSTKVYGGMTNQKTLHPQTMLSQGGGQPHENRQPFLALMFIIALQGIFPSQN